MKIELEGADQFLWQWDKNKRVRLFGVEPGTKVNFSPSASGLGAIKREAFAENGKVFANIPNQFLCDTTDVVVSVINEDDITSMSIPVRQRFKPSGYVLPDADKEEVIQSMNSGGNSGGGSSGSSGGVSGGSGVVVEPAKTTEVFYTYDGDKDGEGGTWVLSAYGLRVFAKIADIPDGELNLVGGTVSVEVPTNVWLNYSFNITEEMLSQTVNQGGVDIKAKVPGLTQIFYQYATDNSPLAMILVCTRPGTYDVAFDGWVDTLNIQEAGIYALEARFYGGSKYVASLACTVTTGGSVNVPVSEKPTLYQGNEIQVFSRGLCIGDSITEGVFDHSDGWTVIKQYSYPSVLKRMTGIDLVNAGVAGLTSKTWYEASLNSDTQYGRWVNGEWAWSAAPEVGENDVVSTALDYSGFDFAIIHLGINDIGMLGSSTIEETLATYETSINNIISKLKEANGGIKVFLATIIPSYANPGNVVYGMLNDKIRAIAEAIDDVYLIDLNAYSDCAAGTAYDNGHLTALGYRKMASEIAALVSYTIIQNLDAFKMVHFIGSEYTV